MTNMHLKLRGLQLIGQSHGLLRVVNLVTFVGSIVVMSLLYKHTPGSQEEQRDQTSMSYKKTALSDMGNLKEIKAIFPSLAGTPFEQYMLNVELSNKLPLDRDLSDERPLECVNKEYTDLPKASVIIPFHNELWSMLLRTVTSVVLRTPAFLLQEVILVDDASTHEYLHKPLEFYIKAMTNVKLIRQAAREGLIRARLAGAAVATGDVLVFLDGHIEVTRGWIEPLLEAIKLNRTILAVPHIDTIDPKTIRYELWDPPAHGAFSWTMDYIWKSK